MNRSRFYVGLVAIVFLVGAASLAQAQTNNSLYWTPSGPAAWSDAGNWTPGVGVYGGYGSIINNGGTATIAAGDNVTDNSPYNATSGYQFVYVGGSSSALGGSGLSGYVNMSGGTVNSSSSATPLQEILGVASGSGIFTQTGGVNLPYAATPLAVNINFNALEVGYSNGGYGEYNLQGGTVGASAIYVGGNVASQYANGVLMQAGTGVFNQTGGAVGSYGINGFGSSANNAVGLTVGGVVGGTSVGRGNYCSSVGTYNLGNGTSSPLLVGGCEVVGA